MKQERYIAIISMYIWADNDKKAVEYANNFTKEVDYKYDNRCTVDEIFIAPVGKFACFKKIYPRKK